MKFNDNPVIAHRGAWKKKNLPENSIAALRQAIELKCAGSEFDVRMTKDDSLIINHDPTFHQLDIEKSTYAQLTQFTLENGEPLPTLAQYLIHGMKNNPGTQLVIEIKPSPSNRGREMAFKVVKLVKDLGAKRWVSYISFDINILKAILEADRSAETQYLNGDMTPEQLKKSGITGLDYNLKIFKANPNYIGEAVSNGQKLNVWTVNDSTDLQWFLQSRFDAITTNEPELLFKIINKEP